MLGLFNGPWSGIPNLVITIVLGLLVVTISAIAADRVGKQYAPLIMVGLMVGLQIMVNFVSPKECTLTAGGQEFFIIAGSLMYPILACGDDYLNEFYGPKVAKASVNGQFIARILTTLYLIWLIFLPCPSGSEENYNSFATLMAVVPRITVASIIAGYVCGILNVRVFDKIKEKTGGKALWLRTFASTAIGLFADAFLFTVIAFAGVKSVAAMAQSVFISLIIRVLSGSLELIFLYGMKALRNKGLLLKDAEPVTIVPNTAG